MIKPGISIIIMIFSETQFLARFLETFFKNNTYEPIELIIIDYSKSSGETSHISSIYATRAFIRFITINDRLSFSNCFSLGASKSRYPYLVFLSDDIVYVDDLLPMTLAKLADPNVSMIRVSMRNNSSNLTANIKSGVQNEKNDAISIELIKKDMLSHYFQQAYSEIQSILRTKAFILFRKSDINQLDKIFMDYKNEKVKENYCKISSSEDHNDFNFSKKMNAISKELSNNLDLNNTMRLVVFASYSSDGTIDDYVVYYLNRLREVVNGIIFISDNLIFPEELKKIENLVFYYSFERHEEYDFGSYKRGYLFAKNKGYLQRTQELILCNDSCFGPVSSFSIMFDKMSKKEYDFWGITENKQFTTHLQSYFLLFKKNVFLHDSFGKFLISIKKQKSVQDVILNYEVALTDYLVKQGFKNGKLINSIPAFPNAKLNHHPNIEHFPCFLIQNGSPLVKVKAFRKAACNLDGIDNTLSVIKNINQQLYDLIIEDKNIVKYQEISNIAFSIIMATYNRCHCICKAIDSVMIQNHQHFELIIIDDGSTDKTEEIVKEKYAKEINKGIIVYIKITKNTGVCTARNIGLEMAQNPWIAYIDSDNTIRPFFLKTFAGKILENPNEKTFYAQFSRNADGHIVGKEFNYNLLLKGNYIDLGVFVHHNLLYKKFGGFDNSLKRLVDWDLILTYTKENPPVFVPRILMDYCDDNRDITRISNKESRSLATQKILKKHTNLPTITTIIVTYNHEKYIKKAIESAISQKGDFIHEIIVSDDGSTDDTAKIIEGYAKKYPDKIRNISQKKNIGISENFKKCFKSAVGEYLAILEGDDYWIDEKKLEIQMNFLKNKKDCSMVFSKIEIHDLKNHKRRTLKRQELLTKEKLDGSDFLAHPSMNLIANFSSCLFRSELIKSIPSTIFEKRINEIAIAFYLEQKGKIGYINRVMSVYQQHAQGLWSGSDYISQLKSGLETRKIVKEIAHEKYKRHIEEIIEQKYLLPLKKLFDQEAIHEVLIKSFEKKSPLFSPVIQNPYQSQDHQLIAALNWKKKRLAEQYLHQGQHKKVSVIMPTYNREKIITRAVNSVIAQTYKNWELIVIDDAGKDKTYDVIKKIADERIHYIYSENNVGAAGARNVGIKKSKGDYIAYLDSDNEWDPNFILIMVHQMEENHADIAYCAQRLLDDTTGKERGIRYSSFNRAFLENRNYIDLNTLVHSRELINRYGAFRSDMRRLVDWDLLLRLTLETTPITIPCILSDYYEGRGDQVTNQENLRKALAQLDHALKSKPIQLDGLKAIKQEGALFAINIPKQPVKFRRKVSIIIPSYQVLPYLRVCVESIVKYTPENWFNLIIVDNNSDQDVKKYLQDIAKTGKIITCFNEKNMGFSYAVNRGIELSEPHSDIILLNNDAVVTPDWLEALWRVKDDFEDVGLIVPRQALLPHTKTMNIHVPFCRPERELNVNVSIHHDNIIEYIRIPRKGYIELSFTPFFAAYIPREVIELIGPLDHENGPHYRSDLLYCEKIRSHGKKIIYTPYSKLYHFLNSSSQTLFLSY